MAETRLPSIPTVPAGPYKTVCDPVKEILEVRNGRRGDPLDAFVPLRDMHSHTPAYGMAYRLAALDLVLVNTWYNVPLTGGNSNLLNVTHSITTNSERIAVNVSGVFMVHYSVLHHRNGAARHGVARLMKNGTTEIPGSWSIGELLFDIGTANVVNITGQTLVELAENEYVNIQSATSADVTNEINYYDDANLPNPTTFITASMIILRIGP